MLSTIVNIVIILVIIGLLRKSKVDNHSNWSQLYSSFENIAFNIA